MALGTENEALDSKEPKKNVRIPREMSRLLEDLRT